MNISNLQCELKAIDISNLQYELKAMDPAVWTQSSGHFHPAV
jgi:hypothetical protein